MMAMMNRFRFLVFVVVLFLVVVVCCFSFVVVICYHSFVGSFVVLLVLSFPLRHRWCFFFVPDLAK